VKKRCVFSSLLTGAWLQLRDALDYADTERFPVAQFGELALFFNFPL
jgi:hypothetical protein